MSRFSERLMEHFDAPHRRGKPMHVDRSGLGALPGGSPWIALHVVQQGERVHEAWFEAEGCGVTIACGSALATLLEGKTLAECRTIDAAAVTAALDGLPPDKLYCAAVAEMALRNLLADGD